MHGMLNDMADRTPRVPRWRNDDLGNGKRVRYLDTPHIPYGWRRAFYEETTDFAVWRPVQLGDGPALTLPILSARDCC
jgi:hypothetical protein